IDFLDIRTGKFSNFKKDPRDSTSVSDNRITKIYLDSKNNVWIGTWSGGLNLFNKKTKRFKRFSIKRDLDIGNEALIYTIVEDRDRRIWLGTEQGAYLLNKETGTFTRF